MTPIKVPDPIPVILKRMEKVRELRRLNIRLTSMDTDLLALADEVLKFKSALLGISGCGTACPCCRMHREIAQTALTGHDV